MTIKRKKDIMTLLIFFSLLMIAWAYSINAGYTKIPYMQVFRALFSNAEDDANLIILTFRLPRMTMAILVGVGFSLSGLILQGLLKNALADPGIIGINAGASIVILLFIVIGVNHSGLSTFMMPLLAFLGASIVGACIYLLSKDASGNIQPLRMILNGVAIQAGINALMTFAVLILDDGQHDMLIRYQVGSVWRSNWSLVNALLPWIIIGFVLTLSQAKYLDALSLGDELAVGLGVDLKRVKRRLIALSVSLAASSVAFSGSMSFVGLIAPHIAKRIFGTRHVVLIPGTAIIGATLVILSDTIGRTLLIPKEIPAGIIVAVIGAPYFLYLMFMQSKLRKG